MSVEQEFPTNKPNLQESLPTKQSSHLPETPASLKENIPDVIENSTEKDEARIQEIIKIIGSGKFGDDNSALKQEKRELEKRAYPELNNKNNFLPEDLEDHKPATLLDKIKVFLGGPIPRDRD